MSYTLTQEEFVRLKRRLTFRQNRLNRAKAAIVDKSCSRESQAKVVFEADQIVKEVDYAMNIFQSEGHPDDWARWERAGDDAKLIIQLNAR
jgi:hypothetical protein